MMETKLEQLSKWFEMQLADCGREQKRLLDDDRADEANFEKIRANIYDIFRTILSVAIKTGEGNIDAVQEFFRRKTEQISASWALAFEEAMEHGDAEQMQVENIKLETVREIKQKFSELWEENK